MLSEGQTGQMNQRLQRPFFSPSFFVPLVCYSYSHANVPPPSCQIGEFTLAKLGPISAGASKRRPRRRCGSRRLSQRTPPHYGDKASSPPIGGKHESSCSAKPGRCRACTRACLETRARSRTQAGAARGGRDGRARVLLGLSDSRASVCSAALQALNASLEKRPEKLRF